MEHGAAVLEGPALEARQDGMLSWAEACRTALGRLLCRA